MPDKLVRCADCGFLAMRHEDSRQLIEAERTIRIDGLVLGKLRVETMPLCFLMLRDFREHIPNGTDEQRRDALNKEHDCTEFTKWRQGFAPKEHQEMIDRQWMLDFQTRRDDADRKWQADQAAAQRRHEFRALSVSIGSMLVALCGVGVAAYASLKQKEPQPAPIIQPTFKPSFQVVIPADPKEKPAVRQIEPKAAEPPA